MLENALDKCYNKDALWGRGKTILQGGKENENQRRRKRTAECNWYMPAEQYIF